MAGFDALSTGMTRSRAAASPRPAAERAPMHLAKLLLAADGVPAVPHDIPAATGGPFLIQVLNADAAKGVVAFILHVPPGGRIPAHRHLAGPEMHYLLAGDLAEGVRGFGPGDFLTQAAGVVHGPLESRGGARLFTVQHGAAHLGAFDVELVETAPAPPPGGTAASALPADPTAPDLSGRDAEAATG